MIACFGRTAGRWVREQLNAHEAIDSVTEENERGWISHTHEAADGRQVVTLTHPSIANWCNKAADPTRLVQRAIKRACG